MQEETVTPPDFKEKRSVSIRLWHWSIFIVIAASLITVLIASTLLKSKYNISTFQNVLLKSGIHINDDQAKALSRSVSHKLWAWHTYFGYILSALFIFRIVLEFFQPSGQKFYTRIKKAYKFLKIPVADPKGMKHYLLVKGIYGLFYVSLVVMVVSGILLAFADELGILKPTEELIKDIHNFNMYVILVFIGTHLSGVLIAELTKHKGITSDMINGGK